MVASSLFLVVITFAFGGLVSLQNAAMRVQQREQTNDQGHLAVQQISETTRSALLLYAPTSACTGCQSTTTAGTGIVIYSETNGIYTCDQWKLVSGSLETRSFSPTWQNDGSVGSWRVVTTQVVNGTSSDPLYPSTTPIFTVSGSTLVVDILTNADTGHSNYLSQQTSVTGRDVEYQVTTSACSTVPS